MLMGGKACKYWKVEKIHEKFNIGQIKKQMTGIEPASSAWEADVLPMNYICMIYIIAYEFKKEKHFIHNNRISAERTRRCMDCPSEAARKLQLQF